MANKKYESVLRNKVLRLHLEEGRTIKSLTEKYNLGNGTLRYWLTQYREECQLINKHEKIKGVFKKMKKNIFILLIVASILIVF
jgi:transposase